MNRSNLSKEDILAITKSEIEKIDKLPNAYIAYIKNDKIRKDSTSGGFFTAVAEEIIDRGGRVYGVLIDSNNKIVHSYTDSKQELWRFRGAKYVQSDKGNTFRNVKKDLKEERWVLYTGTPCEIEGLKSFLQKDYEKLITIDIFCHGVGSPKYWNKYIDYMKKKYKSDIEKIKFREKTYGYNSACMALYFKNGKSSHKGHDDDLYWTAFSKCYIFRPSCYECKFKEINHNSDFSIGDFWDTSKCNFNFRNANGCSLVLIHSDKGRKMMDNISGIIQKEKINLEEALIINGGHQPSKLITSSPKVENREDFFSDLNEIAIDKLVNKYIPLTLSKKLQCLIKPVLYKMKILDIAKRIKRG